MTAHSVNEVINSLSVSHITLIVFAGTVIRLSLIRARNAVAQSTADVLESGLLVIVGMFLIVRPFVLQAYFIPSPSMEPTLLGNGGVGDRIIVNKLVYRLARPSRNDVVVFLPPASAIEGDSSLDESSGAPVNFIKRLIAVPGDRLQVKAGTVWIDGEAYSHASIRAHMALAGVFGNVHEGDDLQAFHHVRFTTQGVLVDGALMSNDRLAAAVTGDPHASVHIVPGVTLLNGRVLNEPFIAEDPDYDLQVFDGQSLKIDAALGPRLNGSAISMQEYSVDRDSEPGRIPPNTYFMMGDNRNDSRDSTEWGPLDATRVVGRAQFIFWPLKRARMIQ